jgi:hypothetical protein
MIDAYRGLDLQKLPLALDLAVLPIRYRNAAA